MAKPKTILFLCTDNHGRSRFAEVLFSAVARRMGLAWQASSRGMGLPRGVKDGPMAREAIQALQAMGIRDADRCGRPPLQATPEELEQADVLIFLQQADATLQLRERLPAGFERAEVWEVGDAAESLVLIERKIMDLMARLLGGGGEAPPQEPSGTAPSSESPRKPMTAKVGRETAGRRGKGVTTVSDLPLGEEALRELAANLKQRCGTGGTVKDGRIEIQGDQRERIIAELEKLGFKVKRVGG